jgi:hypothetical protein
MASEDSEMSKLGAGGKRKQSLIVSQEPEEIRRIECAESQRDYSFIQHWIISCL